jgi:hypothetical protein
MTLSPTRFAKALAALRGSFRAEIGQLRDRRGARRG